MTYLYIFDTVALIRYLVCKYFFLHSVGCLFTLLMFSFAVHKLIKESSMKQGGTTC